MEKFHCEKLRQRYYCIKRLELDKNWEEMHHLERENVTNIKKKSLPYSKPLNLYLQYHKSGSKQNFKAISLMSSI